MDVVGKDSLTPTSLVAIVSAVVLGASLIALLARKSQQATAGHHDTSAPPPCTNGEVHAPVSHKDRCTILFGTQTGTAERFAKSLRSQLESKYGSHTDFEVLDIENYDAAGQLASERLVLYTMATYGDGEPTDSATEFWSWLSAAADDAEQADLLQGVSFAVFGLGNQQYEHFCAMGSKVEGAMRALGASALVPRGEGDDDQDIDADFDRWCADLFAALDKSPLVQKNKGGEFHLTADAVPAYVVEAVADAPAAAVDALPRGSGSSHGSPWLARVGAVRELHRGGGRSCVHVEVDIAGSGVRYCAGDHVGVLAENSAATVEAAAAVLGLPPSMCFRLRVPPGGGHGLGEPFAAGPVTLRAALARHADLLSAPNKAALAALAAFAAVPEEAARLAHLASIEGREAYHEYVVEGKRSLLEVMQDFPSARPSLGAFFGSIAPHLQPRYYSISSSPAVHPKSIHITCAVVHEAMPSGRVHEGVASTWLAACRPGQPIPVFVRPSTFRLPADPTTPVVMVGPGTGLAPFRGFLQERAAAVARGVALGPAHLFCGCRNRQHDYIYQEELEGFVAAGALSQLHVAFSRDGPTKDYVQHHMEAHGREVWDLLCASRGGVLYLCGDAKNMAKDVHRSLHDIVAKATGCSDAQAEVQALSASGRYHKDVW